MYVFQMSSAATEKYPANSYTVALTKGDNTYLEPHRWSEKWADVFEQNNIRVSTWIVPGTEEAES